MRSLTWIGITAALTVAPIPMVQAEENTPSGVGALGACAFGSCFVPLFSAVGDNAVYSGPGAARAEYADCCIAGDRYRVTMLGTGTNKAVATFNSVDPLNGDCSVGPYLGAQAAEVTGLKTVKYKAVALPGGVPASAYLRVSQAGWVQTAGSDSCGF